MAGIGAQADDRHFNRGRTEGVVWYVNDTAEMSQWVKSGRYRVANPCPSLAPKADIGR